MKLLADSVILIHTESEKETARDTIGSELDSITDTTSQHPAAPQTTLMISVAMLVFKSCLGILVGKDGCE